MQKLVAGDVNAVILTENDWSVGHSLNRAVNAYLIQTAAANVMTAPIRAAS
jgi:hypothetical protein